MIPIDVEIRDAVDVERALGNMSDELKRKAVRSGLRAAAKPIADKMKDLAPGRFKQAINVLQFSRRQGERLRGVLKGVRIPDDGVAMIIGPNKKVMSGGKKTTVAQLAHLIEFGTDAHVVKSSGITAFGGDEFASGEVSHPGTDPEPFMSEALRQTDANFQRYFFQGLERHLQKAARKAAR